MKTSLCLCHWVMLSFLLTAGSNIWAYTSGDGTASFPYEINNLDDLLELAGTPDDYSSHFILTADIDMSATEPFTAAVIAPDASAGGFYDGPAFNGVFDGNGHVIRNLMINAGEGTNYIGLFGYAGYYPNTADIKNLGVETITITGADGHQSVGGLVGEMYNGDVQQCYVTGSITLGTDCEKIGGLVGYSTSADVSNCYSMCSVTCGENSQKIGGLMGGCWSVEFRRNYSAGPVSAGVGSTDVGGFLGVNENISVTLANFWDIEASGRTEGVFGTGLRTLQMFNQAPFLNASWDFVDETLNGTHDYWKCPSRSYPILSWQDYTVGVVELGQLADAWLTDSQDPNIIYPVDYWQDLAIDLKDFTVLSQSWLGGQIRYQFDAIFDGFETGDFSALDWSYAADVPWQVSSTDPYAGVFCAQTDATSQLNLAVESGPGKIGFYYQITDHSRIYFYVDGNLAGLLYGPTPGWTYVEYDITGDIHEFNWIFLKLSADIARLDNVNIYSPD